MSRHSSQNRKPRAHILKHKREAERENWKWCEDFKAKSHPP